MRKGSITLTLSLITLVMLSLLFAGLHSARLAASRVVLTSGAEQALYSQFARYDRDLFDQYGLLFIDGGYGSENLQAGKMLKEVREDASYITNPRKGNFLGRDLLGIKIDKGQTALTGYVLATDQNGAAFRRQVCSQMRVQLGETGVEFLKNHLQKEKDTQDGQEDAGKNINSSKAEQYYAEDQKGKTQEELEKEPEPVSSNPIPEIQKQKRSGLMALTLPAEDEVSSAETDLTQMVSHRTLQSGVGMMSSEWQDPDEQILLLEYLAEDFPCYLDDYKEDGLKYQIEYAICGKNTDQANLSGVLWRLLGAREGVNLVYLMTDSEKRQEVDALAQGIACLIMLPELRPVISFALKALWAWGESIVDMRKLMRGEKVVPVKTKETWQLQLSRLVELASDKTEGEEKDEPEGLTYKEYLRMFLLAKGKEKLTNALMDPTEYNMKRTEKNFRLDNCVDAMQIELVGKVGRTTYYVDRSYGYDMG